MQKLVLHLKAVYFLTFKDSYCWYVFCVMCVKGDMFCFSTGVSYFDFEYVDKCPFTSIPA